MLLVCIFFLEGGGQVFGRAKVQYFVYDTTKAELGLGMGVSFAISAFQKYEKNASILTAQTRSSSPTLSHLLHFSPSGLLVGLVIGLPVDVTPSSFS